MPGAPRAAEAARGAAVDAFDASAQLSARCARFSLGYPRSRYRTPETNSSVPMRRSSGELDVNMPPPLDSDTPLSSARALDMATAGAFTTRGVLTGSGARMPRKAAALASTHAVATDLMMHQALGLSSLRFASHLGQSIPSLSSCDLQPSISTSLTAESCGVATLHRSNPFQHALSDAYRGNCRRRSLCVQKWGLRFQEPPGAATFRRL